MDEVEYKNSGCIPAGGEESCGERTGSIRCKSLVKTGLRTLRQGPTRLKAVLLTVGTILPKAVLLAAMVIPAIGFSSCGRVHRAEADTSHHRSTAPGQPWFEDSNNDGLPDSVQLHSGEDKQDFTAWFTYVAEMQFYKMSDAWNPDQRDCAGLVRFALREALRRHDHAWFQKMGPGYDSVAPDVKAVKLETNPLGEKLFRTDFGSFNQADITNGKFSEYADGKTLKNYNCEFISRDRSQARPGDLLIFYQPWVQKYPYHVMIFVGRAQVQDDGSADWVVYHTGSSPADAGTVKKVRLSVLDHHPDPRWRPIESNQNFQGFYRLKILG